MRYFLSGAVSERIRNLVFVGRRVTRRLPRRTKSFSHQLALETLEQRTLLAAIGGFERLDSGGITSLIGASTVATGGEDQIVRDQGSFHSVTSVDAASLVSSGPTAYATAQALTQGRISVDIGDTTSVPEQIVNSINSVVSHGTGSDWASASSAHRIVATSEYSFDAGGASGELEFHGYLLPACGMEQFISGDGLIDSSAFIDIRITSSAFGTYRFYASRINSFTWSWKRDAPNDVNDLEGTGPLPEPWSFSEPFSHGDNLEYYTVVELGGFSRPTIPHGDWHAQNFSTGAAAAFGFVTFEGGSILPGDFDFDDDVDGDDFDLWQESNPQADANLDGVVDDDDLLMWAQNTDELVVTSESDGIDGNYTWGNLTLREAVALAADGQHPGHDDIFFAPSIEEILVTYDGPDIGSAPDPLQINTAMTIHGLGADRLTLNGNQSVSSIFATSYAQNFEVTVRDIKLQGSISYAINVSVGPTLKLDRVEVAGNGQGISYVYGSTLTISNSTIAENNGTAVNVAYATANLYNTTISGNQTSGPTTAGLTVAWGAANLTNVTVTNNRSDKNKTTGISSGIGGIYAGSAATLTLHNTIVVGNFAGAVSNSIAADIGRASSGYYVGTFHSSSSHNLIGSAPSGAFPIGNNNQIGVTAASVGLLALADNKGKTRTHALAQGSIAIDAGDNAKAAAIGLLLDQRGYPRLFDGDFDDIETIDIGAYERAWDDF